MKIIAAAVVVLFAGLAAANAGDVKCSSAEGDFQYTFWFYQGGAAPRFPTTRTTWTYKGTSMKEGEFSEKTVVKTATEGYNRTEIYTALLTFRTNAGPVQDYVICRDSRYVGPPLP